MVCFQSGGVLMAHYAVYGALDSELKTDGWPA